MPIKIVPFFRSFPHIITFLFVCLSSFQCIGETLTVGTLISTGPQRIAFAEAATKFEEKNPGVNIELITRTDAIYKKLFQTWLQEERGPDVLAWQGGERLFQYVRQGKIEPLNVFWQTHQLESIFSASTKNVVSFNNTYYAVPTSYYHWGFYYRKSTFNALNIQPPTTWQEFLTVCERLKHNNIMPITLGSKYFWPAAAWFDYLNLRLNGLAFHQTLLNGKIPFTDPKVVQIFTYWQQLLKPNYFANHKNKTWSEAMIPLFHGDAAMTLIGNFFTSKIPEKIRHDIGFFRFPKIIDKQPMYEEAPLDMLMIPKYSKNKALAKKFLLHMSQKDFLADYNKLIGMVSPNIHSEVQKDYFSRTGAETLNSAAGLSQFFDRDTNKGMADTATRIFVEFIEYQNISLAINKLEAARQEHLLKR